MWLETISLELKVLTSGASGAMVFAYVAIGSVPLSDWLRALLKIHQSDCES